MDSRSGVKAKERESEVGRPLEKGRAKCGEWNPRSRKKVNVGQSFAGGSFAKTKKQTLDNH